MLRSAIWIAPGVLLAIALFEMPYGYYQLLRVVIFCASVYLATQEKTQSGSFWFWAFVACALTYNPIVKLSLGKEIWPFVNIAGALLFAAHFWLRGRDRSTYGGQK